MVTYSCYAKYRDGSTDEVITVFVNCSDDRKRAKQICDDYAKSKRGIMRTWLIKVGCKSELCAKHYSC